MLIVAQLAKHFAEFRRSLHVHRSPHNWTLSQARWLQSAHSHPVSFNIHFNIILPSTPRSPKWSFPFN